jgi:8-oxo-dGTP diphosphatase
MSLPVLKRGDKMKRVDVVYALIHNKSEGKVLMVKNVGSAWTLPGGAVEPGETLIEAVVREAKEETGLDIQAGHVVAVNEKFRPEKNAHAIFFTFIGKVIGGKLEIKDDSEISEIKWVDYQTADTLMPFHPEGVESLLILSAPYHLGL